MVAALVRALRLSAREVHHLSQHNIGSAAEPFETCTRLICQRTRTLLASPAVQASLRGEPTVTVVDEDGKVSEVSESAALREKGD